MKKNRPSPIIYDPMIIPRVKQYLEENVHQTYVDVAVMAKELQDRYREYQRRKTVPFRILVEQAYKTVLHSYGLDSNPSSDGDADGTSDLELMDDDNGSSNHMNDTLTSMYMNNKKTPQQNEGEAIDISSDESDEDSSPPPPPLTTHSTAADTDKTNSAYNMRGITITKLKTAHPNLQQQPHSKHQSTSGQPSAIGAKPISNNKKSSPSDRTEKERSPGPPGSLTSSNAATGIHFNKKRKLESTIEASITGNKPKKFKTNVSPKMSQLTFKNVGGMERTLKDLCELLLHIKHPEVYKYIGLPPPRGFLLHGPPGSGKTLLAHAIAGQLNIPIIEIVATELIAGVSGESEERIRDLFEQASALAPCVLFIDEVDAISSNRINASKDMERRIVTQLLSCLDNLSTAERGDQVLVIGATNRADVLDPALRRVGRFDQEISLGIPDRKAREQILHVICDRLRLERPFDFERLATLTPGYVGADLLALATRAASTAVKRIFSKRGDNLMMKNFPGQTPASINGEVDMEAVVNLTDDTILMDIDVLEKEQTDSVVKESQVEVEDIAKEKIEDEPTEEGKNEEKIIDKDAPTQENVETPNEIAIEEEKKENGDEIAEVLEKEVEKTADLEVADVVVEENNKTEEVAVEPMESIESEANVEVQEKNDDDSVLEIKDDDTLEDAVLKQPGIKLQLTLNEMLTWLTEDHPPVFGKELKNLAISLDDFIDALKVVQPSAKREGFITVPDTTWDDIGSLRDIREELKLAILAPVKFPGKLKILGLNAPSGVLLCGPPGCGKTLLAKAVANEAGINFISVKGPELLNMYVGESERAVRQCFQRARNSAPCVIFFDEFDSLCPKRSDVGEGAAGARVVNQLLTEMDGIEDRKGVFLMAATNRPDMVDPAVLRPGRLDKILYVGFPAESDRVDILKALTKNGAKPHLAADVDLAEVGHLTDGYTGADLAGLVRQASLHALKDSIVSDDTAIDSDAELKVCKDHILKAIEQLKPSVSVEDQKHYDRLRLKYAAPNQLKGNTTF